MGSGEGPIFVVYTEDASRDAQDTLRALAKKALQAVVPGLETHRVGFLPSEPRHRPALSGLSWRGRGSGSQRLRSLLARDISTQVLRGRFVLFHIDADERWGDSSRNAQDLHRVLLAGVRAVLAQRGASPEAFARVAEVVPYWEIEAWTYQNVALPRRLTGPLASGSRKAERLSAWEADPAELDRERNPKDLFGDRYNRALAEQAWPLERALAARSSFVAWVAALGAVPGLAEALRGFQDPDWRSLHASRPPARAEASEGAAVIRLPRGSTLRSGVGRSRRPARRPRGRPS
jgi:hypothetical protein